MKTPGSFIKARYLFLAFVLSAVSFSHISQATDFPDFEKKFEGFSGRAKRSNFSSIIESDSGIRGRTYAEITDELRNLMIQFPNYSKVIEYGTSVGGKKLTLFKIARTDLNLPNSKAIYIGGSIHGDEFLNIEDRIPKWILEDGLKLPAFKKFIDAGGAFYIVPIINPDGYDKRVRYNNNYEDLNRDFTVKAANAIGFTQPETTALSHFLESEMTLSGRKMVLTLDYHCCTGALLYPWSIIGPVLTDSVKNTFIELGDLVKRELGNDIEVGTTPDVLGYEAHGTSKDYYFEKFGALSFTFEGRYGQEKNYFEGHTKMWTALVNSFDK